MGETDLADDLGPEMQRGTGIRPVGERQTGHASIRTYTSTTTYCCSTVTGTVSATYGPCTTRWPSATSTG